MAVTLDDRPPAGTRQFSPAPALRPGDRLPFAADDGTLTWLTVARVEVVDAGIGWNVHLAELDTPVRAGHGTRFDIIRPHR